MKSIIVYKGKYGATRQYAEWVGQAIDQPCFYAGDEPGADLKAADCVVVGTSIYIGKLQINKWLKRNLAFLRGKKIFLFLVAGTPSNEKAKLDSYINANVPDQIRSQCEIFYLPGRLEIKNLSWTDRFMLKMGARLAKDAAEKKRMLSDYDHVKKENLNPLLRSLKVQISNPQTA